MSFLETDLKIEPLRTVGGLQIKWTRNWSENLLLDTIQKELSIAWFSDPGIFCPKSMR